MPATGVGSSLGLTGAEADERRRRGEVNTTVGGTGRSHAAILQANVFSFYNTILFVIGAALLALGRYGDALVSVGLGLLNALISATQEIRAKRELDRLQLLDRALVLVVRDGAEVELAPEEVVRGDVLRVRAGEQVVVDGPLLDGRVEADESLLTGESDAVVKEPGDDLRSGSLRLGRGAPARPRRRRGQLRGAAHRRRPPLHHRPDPAATADHVRGAAGDGPDRADERRDPRAGRAGGVQPAAGRADHRRALRVGALRAVPAHRRRLHRRRGPPVRTGGAGAAGQRRRVGRPRRRRVHRQDREAHHRTADAPAGRARRRGRHRPAGRLRRQRHRAQPHDGRARGRAARAAVGPP
jgi:hypothetical protein